MINFDFLEGNKEKLKLDYLAAKPFPHLVLSDICDEEKLNELYSQIPVLENKSRDYMFANNKFEKSNYKELGPLFEELHDDLHSKKMDDFLTYISAKDVFVDPANHGGGLHQGRKNSFLDMHLDYNYHPLKPNWWREMNLLFYMNKDWEETYGGHLELEDLRTGEKKRCPVPFNTLIIQQCEDYTLHGYQQTSFPEGIFRTSIATYAFTKHVRQLDKPRTTDWFPNKESDGALKKWLGRNFHHLVKIKSTIMGSGTAKNQ